MYWFLKNFVVYPALRVAFRFRVTGARNIPRRGPVILVSNHRSLIDSFFIPLIVRRQVTFLAAKNYFDGRGPGGAFVRGFLLGVGMLPIDRSGGNASRASLDTGIQALTEGKALGIYPEGTRSPDGALHRGRTGVARLVFASGVTVVPIAIRGTENILPKGAKFPRFAKVSLTVGRPLHFDELPDSEIDAPALRAVTDRIMQEIAALGPFEYADSYASTVKNGSARDR
ncbi:lysophospholipid acyltransferase family protein [Frondihabitans cladoniiphilus]|uniref:Lysophospholipid acyltransferase family protein n=1 Tax=Frondihabitans cladoniiphilus TaxID=715785 RepID=A0ABP8VS31_9MICO